MENRYHRLLSSKIFGFFIKVILAASVLLTLSIIVSFQTSEIRSAWYLIANVLFIAISWIGLKLHYKEYNQESDILASKCIDASAKELNKPIILFLRPFATNGQLPTQQNPLLKSLSQFFIFGLDTLGGFESQLHSRLKKNYNTLRLDSDFKESFIKSPIRYIGSMFSYRIGRHLLPETDWEPTFNDLVGKSHAIIVVPPCFPEQSTCDEIEYLAQSGNLDKSIFIMPQSNFKVNISKTKITSNKLWENLGFIFGNKLKLPLYNKLGGLVVCIGGQLKLISGISGAPWYKNKVFKRLLQGGMLTDSTWKDSLRIAVNIGLIYPLIVLIAIGFLNSNIYMSLDIPYEHSQYVAYIVIFVVGVGLIKSHYRHCHNYLLAKNQIWQLSVSTLFACIAGFIISNYGWAYLTHNGWFPAFPSYNGNIDFSIDLLVNLLALFIIPSLLIFCSAYFVLNKRKDMAYYLGGQN